MHGTEHHAFFEPVPSLDDIARPRREFLRLDFGQESDAPILHAERRNTERRGQSRKTHERPITAERDDQVDRFKDRGELGFVVRGKHCRGGRAIRGDEVSPGARGLQRVSFSGIIDQGEAEHRVWRDYSISLARLGVSRPYPPLLDTHTLLD